MRTASPHSRLCIPIQPLMHLEGAHYGFPFRIRDQSGAIKQFISRHIGRTLWLLWTLTLVDTINGYSHLSLLYNIPFTITKNKEIAVWLFGNYSSCSLVSHMWPGSQVFWLKRGVVLPKRWSPNWLCTFWSEELHGAYVNTINAARTVYGFFSISFRHLAIAVVTPQ